MLLKEIRLQTKHLAPLYDFYKDILELSVTPFDTENIMITAGQTSLIFEATDSVKDPFYHFAFNIPSNKIEEAFRWVEGKVELLWLTEYNSYIADFTGWHAKSVYFQDPAGNILELIARFDLNDAVNEPFSSQQFRNISEIGVVLSDMAFNENINKILSNFQLRYFPKQPPLKHFRAIGDDEGLFIVVPENRNWYATNIPCSIFPLAVKFEDNNVEYYLQF